MPRVDKIELAQTPEKPNAKLMRIAAWVALAAVVAICAAVAGYFFWKKHNDSQLPADIFSSNGRVEANQVDISTKLAGRVLVVTPHEGDMVEVGSIVARLDQAEIEAQIRQGDAEAQRARQSLTMAEAVIASRRAEMTFAGQELKRSNALVEKGYTTHEKQEQRQQQLSSALAALNAAAAQANEARAAVMSAEAQIDRLKSVLDDATIASPVRGRMQYRLVEPGAVLPAGGRIATVLDLSDVSMTIFLPAAEAGRLTIGDEARVILDAAPNYVFPMIVSFVAAEAQFTPKTVETSAEREKLMFRIKLKAAPEMLREFEDRVKSGLRGIGYVRTDKNTAWPQNLLPKLPS